MSEESSGEKKKILFVEDDQNIARLFMFNLERAGYECRLGVNGNEGLDLVKSFQPDLIISDIMMPELDGFEFRKIIMADQEHNKIPFIFLTAKGAEEDILQGYDLEIQDYILKTSSPKIVLAKVSAVLKTQESEREKAEAEVQRAADTMGAKVVPDEAMQIEGFKINHWHVPYKQVPGGDFIDYLKIDDNRIAVVIGDVMGKKWGAWYFAIAYAGYVRSAIRFAIQEGKNTTVSQIISKVNESIYNDERISDVFVTISLLILDGNTQTVSYSGAGDLPLFYYDQTNVTPIKSKGLLLGFSIEGNYEDVVITLKPGDSIFLVTDGIIESRNKEADKSFGTEGIVNALMNSEDEYGFETILREFQAFTEGNYDDDVSIIGINVE